MRKVFLKISQNSLEDNCARASFLINLQTANRRTTIFFKKETPLLVLSCEFCNIFKNIHFVKHLRTDASVYKSTLTKKLYSVLMIENKFLRNLLRFNSPTSSKTSRSSFSYLSSDKSNVSLLQDFFLLEVKTVL